jgi:hypothetical protein
MIPAGAPAHIEQTLIYPPWYLEAARRSLDGQTRWSVVTGNTATWLRSTLEVPHICGVLSTCDESVAGRMDWNAQVEAAVPGSVPV